MYGTFYILFSLSSLIKHHQRQSWKTGWKKVKKTIEEEIQSIDTGAVESHYCLLSLSFTIAHHSLEYWQNRCKTENLTFNWSKDIKYWFQHYDGSQKQKINFIWKSIFNSAKQRSYLPAQINQLLIIIFVIIIIHHKHRRHNKDNDRLHFTGKEKVTCANEILPLRLWLGGMTEIKCICSSDKTTDMQDESTCILTCCSSSCRSLNIFMEHQKCS